jgi:hypothetical protein
LGGAEYVTVGLHACGDLSITTHEIALNSRRARGAISVPCCYQHLSAGRVPLLPENRAVCDALFQGSEDQRHNLLNYALYDYEADFETRRRTCDGFHVRAIADFFLPPKASVKKMQRNKGETIVDYIGRLAAHFQRSPTAAEIEEKEAECREKEWQMMAHTLVRERFGHVFETFLLMERLTHFARLVAQRPERFLLGLFDVFSHLSPRGFAIFTIRLE